MRSKSLLQVQASAEVVLVTGDRNWNNLFIIARELGMCVSMRRLVHGNAKGADKQSGRIAKVLIGKDNVKAHTARWNKFGRAAGPIRNRKMQKKEKPQFVLAFHTNLAASKGTADMVSVARKAGIPVKVVTE